MAPGYLAHHLRHDRPVALKVMRRELAAVLVAERLLTAIHPTANLQHPNILTDPYSQPLLAEERR
jgi:hypothetical protein